MLGKASVGVVAVDKDRWWWWLIERKAGMGGVRLVLVLELGKMCADKELWRLRQGRRGRKQQDGRRRRMSIGGGRRKCSRR